MSTAIIINSRYSGPPDSANGGYAAGLMASYLSFTPEITLRSPPPLNHPTQLYIDSTTATLKDGERLIAEARTSDFTMNVIEPVSFELALKASKLSQEAEIVAFNDCFVCGKNRMEGEGLRIRPSKVGHQKVATVWKPHPNFGDANGNVKTEYIWAALDCPGVWALQDMSKVYLLGRIAAKNIKPIKVDRTYIVMGWVIGNEGRKSWTGTAIYESSGEVSAFAKGTWIQIVAR